jgi:hypothetical protein
MWKAGCMLLLIAVPSLAHSQNFAVKVLDENGKDLPAQMDTVPPFARVRITSESATKKFRFQKAEVILSRQKAREVAVEMLSSNLDLRNFWGLTRPGDHLILNISIEEAENGKIVKTHQKVFDYPLRGKK